MTIPHPETPATSAPGLIPLEPQRVLPVDLWAARSTVDAFADSDCFGTGPTTAGSGTPSDGRHTVWRGPGRGPSLVAMTFGATAVVVVLVVAAVTYVVWGLPGSNPPWQSSATGVVDAMNDGAAPSTSDGQPLIDDDRIGTGTTAKNGSAPPASTTQTGVRPTSRPATSRGSARSGTGRAKSATYGQTVDTVDAAPPARTRPGTLPVRRESRAITATGKYEKPTAGSVSGTWVLRHGGDAVTLTGRGYVRVNWELATTSGTGVLQLPVWTGLTGRLFHVASGGGHRMDDAVPGATDRPHTWMGSPATGYDIRPAGAQQMWQNEFYYLDGTVTLHNQQGDADYHLGVAPVTRAAILDDLTTEPGTGRNQVRYGLVRDTGTDAAPVPQYLTRTKPTAPADLLTVPQHSKVR